MKKEKRMSKKLAVIFPGIGYSVERPLLYYTRKLLEKSGYEVINVGYPGLEKVDIFEPITKGASAKRVSNDKASNFVAKAEKLVEEQLEGVNFTSYSKIIFAAKSIGSVISALYAKQLGIHPYHIMVTPIDYAFQFIGDEIGSAFCGTSDPLVNYDGVENICKEKQWDFHGFKSGNHSLETADVDLNIDYLKRYVSVVEDIISDMETSNL